VEVCVWKCVCRCVSESMCVEVCEWKCLRV
jgi:hypothetical protein